MTIITRTITIVIIIAVIIGMITVITKETPLLFLRPGILKFRQVFANATSYLSFFFL